MTIDLTLTHTRVAAACTWGATEATILRELLGPNPALCERLPVIRAIEELETLGALQRSADGHFWLMGESDDTTALDADLADHFPCVGEMMQVAPAVHFGPMPEVRPLGGHIGPAPDAVPLALAPIITADPTIRAEPIRTADAAIRYLEAHGYSVVPLARGLYLIDCTSSLGKADLIDRAEKLRDRTMKRHQQRKARAA
ncbi:hypothetical protein [Elstera cyanobacteriorum]|uniref:hypothetical protein n=1 Tax=Elstera cyanobacteriorum TaxID=2022747 RepID=UPI0023556F8C|nr:hypothetical protein [Elstera cyanobacteriorum]MCK6442304.1 hypothetical protein [Elstera cyanobacteriorum]